MTRKRYILFGYDCYYPCGAKDDEKCRADTIEEIVEWVTALDYGSRCESYDVLDLDTGDWIDVDFSKPKKLGT